MLPPCSDDKFGVLPASPTPHLATLSEIRARFVDEAPEDQRERRELIADALALHVALVRRLFDEPTIWLNGGFCTHKTWRVPRDADLLVLIPSSEMPLADRDVAIPLWTLANVTAQRGGDGPTIVTPKLHTGLGLTDAYVVRSDRAVQVERWRRRWSAVTGPDGTIIEGKAKGFVEVIADEQH